MTWVCCSYSTGAVASSTTGDEGRAVDVSSVRIGCVDVVEDIESVHAEQGGNTFLDGEVLLHSKIGIEEARAEVAIAADVSNLIESGAGESASRRSCWIVLRWAESIISGFHRLVKRPPVVDRVECAEMSLQTPWISIGIERCIGGADRRGRVLRAQGEW